MSQYGYRACDTPNRTRQAILVFAYIMMAILAVAAAFSVSAEDNQQSWAATEQPETVTFTSFRTWRQTAVPLKQSEDSDVDVLTREDLLAGFRIMRRMGVRYLTDTTCRGQVAQRTIIESLNEVLHHGDTWTPAEIEMLHSVFAATYPHITVL